MEMPKPMRAKRDPEGRRRAIIEAAAEIIAREGTRKLTHRRVAQQAGVPLGSTTQYFSSIDELHRAALAELARLIEEETGLSFGGDQAQMRALTEAMRGMDPTWVHFGREFCRARGPLCGDCIIADLCPSRGKEA